MEDRKSCLRVVLNVNASIAQGLDLEKVMTEESENQTQDKTVL